jgi:uncharacterized membrane protein
MATASGNPVATQTSLQHWLRINPKQKPQVYAQITATAEMSNIRYWLEILLSAGIAAFGLVLDSPAVIIGAMLISPLMGPIMATGLALAAGDLYLAIKAVANLVASISLAITFSAVIVWLLPFHSVTAEVLARTIRHCLISVSRCSLGWLVRSRCVVWEEETELPRCPVSRSPSR